MLYEFAFKKLLNLTCCTWKLNNCQQVATYDLKRNCITPHCRSPCCTRILALRVAFLGSRNVRLTALRVVHSGSWFVWPQVRFDMVRLGKSEIDNRSATIIEKRFYIWPTVERISNATENVRSPLLLSLGFCFRFFRWVGRQPSCCRRDKFNVLAAHYCNSRGRAYFFS